MNTCKYCGEEIKNTNAPECDRCWEIQWHCIGHPELVAKILSASNNSVQSDDGYCVCGGEGYVMLLSGAKICNLCKRPRR